ncbi:AAA-like domain-containing protein [Desulfobacterales bacterium HSG16]|nr:AAA-like domain-containing protein [Desulfobacterales bacterium HSG16]
MKRFHSYGPVNSRQHFTVPRKELVRSCCDNLIGDPEKGGHYFTIWSPRQTGKTWLMRQSAKVMERNHREKFIVGMMSVQGVVMDDEDPDEMFLEKFPQLIWEAFEMKMETHPKNWESFKDIFSRKIGIFDRPLILFIDEFDSLPPKVIDRLVTLFRDMYQKRDSYLLHGLALIGVRSAIGVESLRGSPFNIQRSLHVPNFTREGTNDLFRQYQVESGQTIDNEVVGNVFDATSGQPGLVCWFGELLTEKYNPGKDKKIDLAVWAKVYHLACDLEMNNTVLNLIKKARKKEYRPYLLKLFTKSDVAFKVDARWCGYLYLNGIIMSETGQNNSGGWFTVCRFSCPFIQHRLYNAFTDDLVGDDIPIPALEPLDDLADVFEIPELDLPALLMRYKAFLKRLKAKGANPWKDQPRRADMHLTEAVGHFHLYAWLKEAVDDLCVVSPEFPTGNGKVDLHLKCSEKRGIIEIKNYKSRSKFKKAINQAGGYGKSLGLDTVTLAVFVPTDDEEILAKLSGEEKSEEVRVMVVAIGWV